MKNKKYRLGLSILAGGLSFVGAANATNVFNNSSFENPQGVNDWQGYYSTYTYSQAYYTGPAVPDSDAGDQVLHGACGFFGRLGQLHHARG